MGDCGPIDLPTVFLDASEVGWINDLYSFRCDHPQIIIKLIRSVIYLIYYLTQQTRLPFIEYWMLTFT
jgi:hypothetical protein